MQGLSFLFIHILMNADLLSFQQAGMAFAMAAMGRSVTYLKVGVLTTVTGVRTEVTIDPGSVVPGGFKYKRLFSLLVNDATLTQDLKVGTEVTDDMGLKSKFLRYDLDHLGTHLYFGSINS